MTIDLQRGRRARRARRMRGTTTGAAGDCRVMYRPSDLSAPAWPHDSGQHRADARRTMRSRRKRARSGTRNGTSNGTSTLAVHQAAAAQEQRHAIARALHDDLGQLIALAQLRLGELSVTPMTAQAARLTAQLSSLMAQSSISLRRTCFTLMRPDEKAPEVEPDMATAIERHCRELARSFDQHIEFHCEGERPALPPSACAIVLRAARELIVNACKHAHAHRIDASMLCSARELRLEISDDGRGIASQPTPRGEGCGFGLDSIRRQLAALGARLSIAAQPGGGTLCRLQLPLQFP